MSDFNSSLPVRTETNGDVVARLVDGSVTSQYLAIDASGRITVNQGPAASTHASPWWIRLTDGTNDSSLLSTGELKVSVTQLLTEDHNFGAVGASTLRSASQIGNATGAADFNFGAASAQTLRVAALPGNASGIADFNNGTTGAQTPRVAANLAVGGADVSSTNPVPVTLDTVSGTPVNDYKKTTATAAAASDNHDYTVTALKTLTLTQVEASGSGKIKMELQVETGVATGVFTPRLTQFNSTATPNTSVVLSSPISVAAGVRVRVIMTNEDKAAQDLYSTISGDER